MSNERMRRVGYVSGSGRNYSLLEVDGNKFDTVSEKNRYLELKRMENAGTVAELKCRPKWEIIPAQRTENGTLKSSHYTADFSYIKDGKLVVEDVRNGRIYDIGEFRLKKKLMYLVHGILIDEI